MLPALGDASDVGGLMSAIARGERLPSGVTLDPVRAAVTTVLAAGGYPEHPQSGDRIDLPAAPSDTLVFHAGTRRLDDGSLVTNGGRVLAVTGLGDSIEAAQARSQAFASMVQFAGKQYRTDIGWRALTRASLP